MAAINFCVFEPLQ